MTTCSNRGSAEDQDRWLAALESAEVAENFPSGGNLILAESPEHALQIAEELKTLGQRVIVRGVYVHGVYDRTTPKVQES